MNDFLNILRRLPDEAQGALVTALEYFGAFVDAYEKEKEREEDANANAIDLSLFETTTERRE